MECLECHQEIEDCSYGSESYCEHCDITYYRCCFCGTYSSDEYYMHYDEDCGRICDDCKDETKEIFSLNDEDMQDTDYSWGL